MLKFLSLGKNYLDYSALCGMGGHWSERVFLYQDLGNIGFQPSKKQNDYQSDRNGLTL